MSAPEETMSEPPATRCLIASDIDKTLLDQGKHEERQLFLRGVATQLRTAAGHGAQLAFLTGNSIEQLVRRFLSWWIEDLVHVQQLELLSNAHFFANSTGVYFHFPASDPDIIALVDGGASVAEVRDCLLTADGTSVRPKYLLSGYAERCDLERRDLPKLEELLENAGARYQKRLHETSGELESIYDIERVRSEGEWMPVCVQRREVACGEASVVHVAQMTLKPVLSFRHAHQPEEVFGSDIRSELIAEIQASLDAAGLGHYVARPGGRGSIDLTLDKLDKRYGLTWLIDRLNLHGSARRGELFGANAIYFGDEVIVGGGNDYPVTHIPGLLVFAVNQDRALVPMQSRVLVPSTVFVGPKATEDVLRRFNRLAANKRESATSGSPLSLLKRELFLERLTKKLERLRDPDLPENHLRALHAFATLSSRKDEQSRRWADHLIDQLDDIMARLDEGGVSLEAIGASHPDG